MGIMTTTNAHPTISNRHDFQSATHLILVVARRGHLSAHIKRYALEVAQRTGHDLLMAYVNTLPQLFTRNSREQQMHEAAEQDFTALSFEAAKAGINTAFVFEAGKIGKVVARLCHLRKKINFVIIDEDIRMEDVVNYSPVPVFRGKGSSVESSRPMKNSLKPSMPRAHHDMTLFLAMQQIIRFLSAAAVTALTYIFLFSYNDRLDMIFGTGGAAGLFTPLLVVGLFFSQSFMLSAAGGLIGLLGKTSQHIKTVVISSKPGKAVHPVKHQQSVPNVSRR